jgi:hypothetical protein
VPDRFDHTQSKEYDERDHGGGLADCGMFHGSLE